MKHALRLLLLCVSVAAAACGHSTSRTADLAVTLVTEPKPPRVGENLLRARVSGPDGASVAPSGLRFHYYPFVHRVKDSLASPDEVVRVVEGSAAEDGYRATVNFDRPGLWKVTLKIIRPDRPEALVTFTFDVRGEPGST